MNKREALRAEKRISRAAIKELARHNLWPNCRPTIHINLCKECPQDRSIVSLCWRQWGKGDRRDLSNE